MSDITVNDNVAGETEALQVEAIRVGGLGDIINLIGNLLKNNLLGHVQKMMDIFFVNPSKYTVADMLVAIKDAANELLSLFNKQSVGPPKALGQPENYAICFRSDVERKARPTPDDVIKELEGQGVDTKAIPITLIFGIISLVAQFGPAIYSKIIEWLKSRGKAKAE